MTPGTFRVERVPGAHAPWDEWEDIFTFCTEANGALTVLAWPLERPFTVACVYAPGTWLLVRAIEPTA